MIYRVRGVADKQHPLLGGGLEGRDFHRLQNDIPSKGLSLKGFLPSTALGHPVRQTPSANLYETQVQTHSTMLERLKPM